MECDGESSCETSTCELMPGRESYRDFIYEETVKNCQWYLSCMGKYNMMGFITLLLTFIFGMRC